SVLSEVPILVAARKRTRDLTRTPQCEVLECTDRVLSPAMALRDARGRNGALIVEIADQREPHITVIDVIDPNVVGIGEGMRLSAKSGHHLGFPGAKCSWR